MVSRTDALTLAELTRGLGVTFRDPSDGDVVIDAGVEVDSRRVEPGGLFVAMSGAVLDGHRFVPVAIAAGASAVVVEPGRVVPEGVAVAYAESPRAILGAIASRFHGVPSHTLDVVGVTGTNGKTTTTYILECILEHAGRRPGVIGTVNYRWPGHVEPAANTTPGAERVQQLLAAMEDAGAGAALMEVSSHGLATHRLDGTRVRVGVFTNLTQDHLDFHGSMEAYRDAKARLFTEILGRDAVLERSPVAVLNADDPEGVRLSDVLAQEHQGVRVVTYSVGSKATWSAREVELGLGGVRFEVERVGDSGLEIATPMLGDYNVSNTLAAACAAHALGVPDDAIVEGLAAMPQVPGRLECVAREPAVFVDYAHTPDALERSLGTLREVCEGRLIVVFGCGGDRDAAKRPLMGRVARERADEVWVTSDNPRTEDPRAIVDAILEGIEGRDGVHVEVERDLAIVAAVCAARPEDVVLVAGKGHETYQDMGGTRRDFDDRVYVGEGIAARE